MIFLPSGKMMERSQDGSFTIIWTRLRAGRYMTQALHSNKPVGTFTGLDPGHAARTACLKHGTLRPAPEPRHYNPAQLVGTLGHNRMDKDE